MSEIILNQILTELKEIKHEQTKINEQIDQLDKRIKTMNKRKEGSNSHLDSHSNTVKLIHDQIEKLTEYHSNTLKAIKGLASQDDVDYLIDKVGKHDREIYKLKNKLENQTSNE
ncbi:MAG TPA: hypothetical protein GXZ58_09855 [Bacilli bacterium]|nr:hypothetical protein [Bacilli bacterium]